MVKGEIQEEENQEKPLEKARHLVHLVRQHTVKRPDIVKGELNSEAENDQPLLVPITSDTQNIVEGEQGPERRCLG
jgi:hypothetical protein